MNKDKRKHKLTAIGHRVRMSKLAIERGLHKTNRAGSLRQTTGIVKGESRDGNRLWVQLDGSISKRPFATQYWELDEAD